MVDERQRADRRRDVLSRARIVGTAIELLDEGGADALTFRTLAARLSTGAGAIYHHVANKGDLLAAAAGEVLASVSVRADVNDAQQGVRAVMLGAFDVISAHPWVGTQLAAAPWQPAVLGLFERVGSALASFGVPEAAQFDAASVLLHQVLGVASQYDAATRLTGMDLDRPAFLASAASDLLELGANQYPFLTRVAGQLAGHDDRGQFLAGVDIILAGVTAHAATAPQKRQLLAEDES